MLTILLARRAAIADPQTFQDYNFAIEIPADWKMLQPPPPQTLAAFQATNGLKSIIVIATKIPAKERSIAARDMVAGAKQSMIDKGWQIINEHDTTLGGLPFHAFTTRVSEIASMVTYIGVTRDEGYSLSGACKTCDASSDPNVMAIINSFHLLSPKGIPTESTPEYQFGSRLGLLIVLALVGVGVVRFLRKKTKTQR